MFKKTDFLTGFDTVLTVDTDGRPHLEERPNTFEYNQKAGTITPISKDGGNDNDE